jgi:hypothetical protein
MGRNDMYISHDLKGLRRLQTLSREGGIAFAYQEPTEAERDLYGGLLRRS